MDAMDAVPQLSRNATHARLRELGIQLRRDMKPALDAAGVGLLLVSIGTPERALQFAEVTKFPTDRLLADPTSETYEALGLVKGVAPTFLGRAVRTRCGHAGAGQ